MKSYETKSHHRILKYGLILLKYIYIDATLSLRRQNLHCLNVFYINFIKSVCNGYKWDYRRQAIMFL